MPPVWKFFQIYKVDQKQISILIYQISQHTRRHRAKTRDIANIIDVLHTPDVAAWNKEIQLKGYTTGNSK